MRLQTDLSTEPTRPSRRLLVACGAALLISVLLTLLLVRYRTETTLILIGVTVIVGSLLLRFRSNVLGRSVITAAAIGASSGVAWLATHRYALWLTLLIVAFVLAVGLLVAAWRRRGRGVSTSRKVARGAGVFITACSVFAALALLTLAITPAPLALAMQSAAGSGNSYHPAAEPATTVVSGTRVTTDVRYASTYPNSYLDIYIADNDPAISRPTYVIVHGGGFIAGSKSDGDPNAGDSYFALGGGPMLEADYNIVAIDYALAPQYEYPTPTIQLGQALEFLRQHGDEYGLDTSRVVLSGGSAGGHVAAQYAAIETNPEYAAKMGIAPVLEPGALKAVVLDSAALVPSRAGATQSPNLVVDWVFDLSARSYIGTSQALLAEANILEHVDGNYPPTFIADGNSATFTDQARDLADTLNMYDVPHHLDLYPRSAAVLGHGYMVEPSRWTDSYNDHKIEFLADYVD